MFAREGNGVVRLCNISPIGALIEGAELPTIGHDVELSRGALSVPGRIVWRGTNQAGVSFSERTEVAEWFPDAVPQTSVDKAFQRILEEFQQSQERTSTAPAAPTQRSYVTVDDIQRVALALDQLADSIAEDHEVVQRFSDKLQTLDIAAQMLRKLSDQIEDHPT